MLLSVLLVLLLSVVLLLVDDSRLRRDCDNVDGRYSCAELCRCCCSNVDAPLDGNPFPPIVDRVRFRFSDASSTSSIDQYHCLLLPTHTCLPSFNALTFPGSIDLRRFLPARTMPCGLSIRKSFSSKRRPSRLHLF